MRQLAVMLILAAVFFVPVQGLCEETPPEYSEDISPQLERQADTLLREVRKTYAKGATPENIQEALDKAEEALVFCEAAGYARGIGMAAEYMSLFYLKLGQFERSIEYANKSLASSKYLHLWEPYAAVLNIMGHAYSALGRLDDAYKAYEEALDVARNKGYSTIEAESACNLGLLAFGRRHFDKAEPLLERCVKVEPKGREPVDVSNALRRLAELYERTGRPEEALETFRKLAEASEDRKEFTAESFALLRVGNLLLARGDDVEARENYLAAVEAARKAGDLNNERDALSNLGRYFLERKDYEDARKYYEKALAVDKKMEDNEGRVKRLGALGFVHGGMGDVTKAWEFFDRSSQLAEETGNDLLRARVLLDFGEAALNWGSNEKAREYWERALPLAQKAGASDVEAKARIGLEMVTE